MSAGQIQLPSRRTIDAIGVVAALAVSAGGYMLVVQPAMQETLRRSELARKAEEVRKAADDAAVGLRDAQKRLAQVEDQLGGVDVKLVAPTRINQQMDALTMLAQEHRLRITQLSPDRPERNRWFTGVPIRMSGEGTFPACVAFVEAVSARHNDVAVRGLRLAALSSGPGPAQSDAPTPENADGNTPKAPPQTPATFDVEFVWYAAPDGLAGVDDAPKP